MSEHVPPNNFGNNVLLSTLVLSLAPTGLAAKTETQTTIIMPHDNDIHVRVMNVLKTTGFVMLSVLCPEKINSIRPHKYCSHRFWHSFFISEKAYWLAFGVSCSIK